MNIFILVSAFLIMLSLLSSTLLSQKIATFWEERSYTSYVNAERSARGELAKKQQQKAKSKKTDKKSQQEKVDKTEKKIYTSPRDKQNANPLSKFNLYPLFSSGKPSDQQYEIAAKLLHTLYEKTSFFKEAKIDDLEYKILDAMIANYKIHPESTSVAELFPSNEPLKPI